MELSKYIDHTLLKPTATKLDIKKLCDEAIEYQFFSVCVNSYYVGFAKKQLKGSNVKVCAVVGFPLGAMSTKAKAFEAKQASKKGADEVDMVLHIGALKDKAYHKVSKDIAAVKKELPTKVLKVILETCYLTANEITKATILAIEAGADFVKTSTGFGTGGATLEAVQVMQKAANDKVQIKASGGIRDAETALRYIQAGASRLGTSSGIAIVTGKIATENY